MNVEWCDQHGRVFGDHCPRCHAEQEEEAQAIIEYFARKAEKLQARLHAAERRNIRWINIWALTAAWAVVATGVALSLFADLTSVCLDTFVP